MKRSNANSERKEPEFLIEMPHSLRHLIMKRGQMLRSGRTRTMFCLGKGGPKSWLQAKLIPNAGESTEENWDKAHELANRFKRELSTSVYAEPCSQYGRYLSSKAAGLPITPPMPPVVSDPVAMHDLPGNSQWGGFDPFSNGLNRHSVGAGFGASAHFGSMGMGPGVEIPDPLKFGHGLPPEIQALVNGVASPPRKTAECPALHQLRGWDELPINKQQMFETEASQLISSGLVKELGLPAVDSESSTIHLIALQPKISKALKAFLEESMVPSAKTSLA